jgi:hypothetical protein
MAACNVFVRQRAVTSALNGRQRVKRGWKGRVVVHRHCVCALPKAGEERAVMSLSGS